MFNIIVDGEVVETVMYDTADLYSIRRYVREEYHDYGIKATFRAVRE